MSHSHSRSKRDRPRSLVFQHPTRSSSEAAPRTHRSLPAKFINNSTGIPENGVRPAASTWSSSVSQPGTPDDHAAVARSVEGRVPFEIDTLPDGNVHSDGFKISPRLSPNFVPGYRPLEAPLDIPQQPPPSSTFLPINGGRVSVLPQQDGREPSPKRTGTWPQNESGVEERVHFARLLRKVRRLTDEVLLKRTEWRHEYDQLEHRRRFLNTSTADLMAAMEILLGISEGSSGNRSEEPEKAAGSIPGLEERSPSDSNTDRSGTSSNNRDERRDSSSVTDPDTRSSQGNNLAKLNHQYHEDYKAVQTQESKTTQLGDDLSNLEYRLQNELKLVQQRMYTTEFVSDLKSEAMREPLAPSEGSSCESSEVSLPPLVAQYFDMKGDVGIFQERLQELDFAHGEGLTERAFVRERGDPVVPSDEEFDYNYRMKRKEIEQDLKTAQEEVEMLHQRCVDAGDLPETYRTSRPSLYPASTQQSGQIALERVPDIPLIHEVQLGRLGPPAHTERHSTHRIDSWLRSVEPETSVNPPQFDASEPGSELHQVTNSHAAGELNSFDADTLLHVFNDLQDHG